MAKTAMLNSVTNKIKRGIQKLNKIWHPKIKNS